MEGHGVLCLWVKTLKTMDSRWVSEVALVTQWSTTQQ